MADTPTFPRADPATPEFWDMRFQADFTPWDQHGVPQLFSQYVHRRATPGKVLIPGCGSAWEVRFLAEAGWQVTAVDFSPVAVARAAALLGPLAGNVRLGDFFSVEAGPIDTIYERAFLCALPRDLWGAWADRVAALLPAGGVLLGFFFFDGAEKGPPFGLAPPQLDSLLSKNFILREETAPPDSLPVFAGKERWMVWERR
ncbi:MAG: methyltransferase domain-containing protein [Betaproteobacteria bacterium]|nr:methyltransferase domain-containing protein [Betaproteobacteria bacterium]